LAPGHVVVGWGTVDFHINEWLTGHASVVVDPDGYITSHGILRPTREYQFLNEPGKYETNRLIGELSKSVTLATIGIASLSGNIDAKLRVGGRVGPARLYGLEIEGQFSTRPGTVFTGRVTGRANLSAQGSVAASLTGSLSGNIGTPPAEVRVVKVALNVIGQATLRAYVELQPTFERIAGPNPDEAQYRITGTLTAAGAVSLGLRGSVDFSIAHVGPRINLGKVQYPLGSVSLTATISHVLGSNHPIEIDVSAADFKEAQYTGFVQDLFDEAAPEDEGGHDAELGQAAGKPPARTPHPTALQTTFTMSGTPHTLWLEHTPGPALRMASNGDESLDTKLRNEIATVEQQRGEQQDEEAELLKAEAQSARSLLSQSTSVERSLGELESETQSNPDTAGFNELTSGLTVYGTQYGKTDLAQAPPASSTSGTAEPKETASEQAPDLVTDVGGGEEVLSTFDAKGMVNVTYKGKSTSISLSDKKNNQKLVRDLGMKPDQARKVLQEIHDSMPQPRKTLISFAVNIGNPVAYLQQRLHDPMGSYEGDAFERIPSEEIRLQARIGRGSARLSAYALVFEELYPDQFTPKTSKTTPYTEWQHVDPVSKQRISGAQVRPRAVVRVNAAGEIVEIIDHIIPGTPQQARAILTNLFTKQGWQVNLDAP
jgi:hypothetical protein